MRWPLTRWHQTPCIRTHSLGPRSALMNPTCSRRGPFALYRGFNPCAGLRHGAGNSLSHPSIAADLCLISGRTSVKQAWRYRGSCQRGPRIPSLARNHDDPAAFPGLSQGDVDWLAPRPASCRWR